eukprot:gene5735-7919_t
MYQNTNYSLSDWSIAKSQGVYPYENDPNFISAGPMENGESENRQLLNQPQTPPLSQLNDSNYHNMLLLERVVNALLTLMGLTYSFMGLFCLNKVRDVKMARYMQILSQFQAENVRQNQRN